MRAIQGNLKEPGGPVVPDSKEICASDHTLWTSSASLSFSENFHEMFFSVGGGCVCVWGGGKRA